MADFLTGNPAEVTNNDWTVDSSQKRTVQVQC